MKQDKNSYISKESAIELGKEYLQTKDYRYEINWDEPNAKLVKKALKKDGSISGGFGEKIQVWHVWFMPVDSGDSDSNVFPIGIDIDAKTGKIYSQISMDKL